MTTDCKVIAWAVVDKNGRIARDGAGDLWIDEGAGDSAGVVLCDRVWPSNGPHKEIPMANASELETFRADALRYRWLLTKFEIGAVETQLPLYPVPHLHLYEQVSRKDGPAEIQNDIDNAMAAEKEST